MVVSGVPKPRSDHVQAIACLALDMADAVADLKDPQGRAVPLRIGLAAGPVVAGVVGARKFFYDVWGDAVNVASRMESTDVEGRIQVPQSMYERLKDGYVLEERGDVDVKGKGLMHTWYLVGRRNGDALTTPNCSRSAVRQLSRFEPLSKRAEPPQRLSIARPRGEVGQPVRQHGSGSADGILLHHHSAAVGNIAEPQDNSGTAERPALGVQHRVSPAARFPRPPSRRRSPAARHRSNGG